MKQLDLRDFDAVAFDLEGTLADTIPTHHRARQAAFEQYGYGHITREQHELGPTYGSTANDIIGGVLHAAGEIDRAVPFSENPTVQAVVAAKNAHFAEEAAAGFEAMPGAVEFVHLIAPRFAGRLALVTTAPTRVAQPFVERYELGAYFPVDHLVTDDVLLAAGLPSKPAPDAYRLAMERLGVKRLLVFEDTAPGVESAKRAGATVIALGFDANNARLFAAGNLPYPPDVFVRDYAEARQVLGL